MQARAEIIAKATAKNKMAAFVVSAKIAPTTLKIANTFGLSKTIAGTYLRELERAGEIHRREVAPGAPSRSGKLPAIWVPGKGEGYIPEDERVDPIITLRQRSVHAYPAHHVRDPFVAAIFGQAVHS